MTVTLIYFSQTGNTRKIANAMSEAFEQAGHSVKSHDMQKVNTLDLSSSDLIGIGCPTFECTIPTPVKEFLNSLTLPENQKMFVFATQGGASGNVLSDLNSLLKKKGANVLAGLLSPGQVRHPAPCLVGKTPNRPNIDDLFKAKNFALTLSKSLGNNTVSHSHTSLKLGLKQKYGFYNLVGLVGSSNKMIRILEPKPKNNQEKCKQCNACVQACPVNNISSNPYPKLDSNCIRCYRCLNVCPSKAMSVNWNVSNVILWALYNETFMRWFGNYEK